MSALMSWINRDLWGPVWPNLAASAITTVPVLAWHHRRIRHHITSELGRQGTIEHQSEEAQQ